MKIRGSMVSLSFIFPHPPEDLKKKKKYCCTCQVYEYRLKRAVSSKTHTIQRHIGYSIQAYYILHNKIDIPSTFYSFLFFSFLFQSFPFLSFLFFRFPTDLSMSCVCVATGPTSTVRVTYTW